MLSAEEIIKSRKPCINAIPIPSKEFGPNHTLEEKSQIQNTLSKIQETLSTERVKKLSTLSQAEWLPELKLAEVTLQVGSHWTKIGKQMNNKLYLHPEESLYMLENGLLEIKFNQVPMSIQRAYFVLLGSDPIISLEKYRVYSNLKSMGYKVVRHSSEEMNLGSQYFSPTKHGSLDSKKRPSDDMDQDQYDRNCRKKLKFPSGTGIDNSDVSDFKQHLKNLEIFNCADKFFKSSLTFDFDIYIPLKAKSCKKNAKIPSYRVIVHRGFDPMPDLRDISGLANKFSDDVPAINAIVFPDHVAFYQICPVNLPNALTL